MKLQRIIITISLITLFGCNDNKKCKDLDYDETLLSPTLIIDDHYVYSFQNLVMQKVAVFGIWINANTGEITTNDESIWLEEKDIVSFKK